MVTLVTVSLFVLFGGDGGDFFPYLMVFDDNLGAERKELVWEGPISQNHRMVGIGRDLCGSSSPTLLPKQGHQDQATQDLVQMGLEYLQRRSLQCLWAACSSAPSPSEGRSSSSEEPPHFQVLKLLT